MGTNAVGAMIVAGREGLMKTHYRIFNIKGEDLTPGDDFGMMREVLRRRFTRLAKEDEGVGQDPDAFPQRPDLILIDGGKGQFEAARGPFWRTLVSMTLPWSPSPRASTARPGARPSLSRARSRSGCRRATRRSISSSGCATRRTASPLARIGRAARRNFTRNPLDEIAGVGPARKRALLQAFGTAKAVARAGLADLEKVDGINSATAKLVYDFFHGERA